MEAWEEWESDEIGQIIPASVLKNLRDIVDRVLIVWRLQRTGGETAGTHEYSSVGKSNGCGIPTAVIHGWPGGPFVCNGIVKRRTVEPLAVEKMPPGDQQAAIRQESVAGAEKIDGIAVGIGGLITRRFRGS